MKERIIYIKDFPFESFIEIKVFQAANQHMRAKFTGIISREFAADYCEKGIFSKTVSVNVFDENNERYTWLNGIVDNMKVSACGGVNTLSLEIVSHSIRSDINVHTRTFQDLSLTYEDVISIVSKHSGEDKLEVLIQNAEGKKTIDTFLVQYEETDWEFLKRLASRSHGFLFPCSNLDRNGIYLGMHPYRSKSVLDTTEYVMRKNMKEYYDNQTDPSLNYNEASAISYIVESNHIYQLCDCLIFNGIELFVFSIESNLVGAHLVHTYTLKKNFGFQTRRTYNDKLTGVALNGTVLNVHKDMVQVRLENDIEQRNYRWFPYSTVYSSPDNTGWYFMPEIGDQVRLVFLGDHEEESYIASSVHTGERADSDIKSIRTQYKKEVVFSPDSILISNGAGSHIELNDAAGITIYSEKQIVIESEDNIDIKGKGELQMMGNSGVTLQQEGNQIDIADTIDITAGRLRLR